MQYFVAFVSFLLVLVASPLSVSAQEVPSGAEPNGNELTPASEPAPQELALQLGLDAGGLEAARSPPRTPDGYTPKKADERVRRARIGLGVSAGFFAAGIGLMVGGSVCANRKQTPDDEFNLFPPPGCTGLLVTGGIVNTAGLVGMIVAGVRLAKRKRDRDSLRDAHPGLRSRYHEAVEVDTSDDAFFVVVTRKYQGHELVGATVFIRHKDSGHHAVPYVDAAEIDTLDQVIRDHKAKLLTSE